jgi:hypothetical protein
LLRRRTVQAKYGPRVGTKLREHLGLKPFYHVLDNLPLHNTILPPQAFPRPARLNRFGQAHPQQNAPGAVGVAKITSSPHRGSMSVARKLSRRPKREQTEATKPLDRPLLEIGRYHRNEQNAEQFTLGLFKQLRPGIELPEARRFIYRADLGGKMFEISFRDALNDARETGTVQTLRSYLYADPYFPMTVGIMGGVKGLRITIKNALGETIETGGAMRNVAVEEEFTGDILEHRRQACETSVEGDFARCCMHFRAYVLSCSAVLEAFLYRPIVVELAKAPNDRLLELAKPGTFESRLGLWVDEFCQEPFAKVRGTPQWNALMELRSARNDLLHPPKSQMGFELQDIARRLNHVRTGIGGFMNLLRSLQGCPPLAIAERLETAPVVRFVG